MDEEDNREVLSMISCPFQSILIKLLEKRRRIATTTIIIIIIIIIIMGDLYSAFHSTRRFTKISIHS